MKKKAEKDKKQKAQRILLKSWEVLQENVGIVGRAAINKTMEI